MTHYKSICVGGPHDGRVVESDRPSTIVSGKKSLEGRPIDGVEYQFMPLVGNTYPDIGVWVERGHARTGEALLRLINNYKPTKSWEPRKL